MGSIKKFRQKYRKMNGYGRRQLEAQTRQARVAGTGKKDLILREEQEKQARKGMIE